jgi:hypothetical protein
MENEVKITYFDNTSFRDFIASPMNSLGYYNRISAASGTIIVLVNLDTQSIFGVCMLSNWEGTRTPCRQRHFLDADVYGEEYRRYNKYEICIENLRILKKPLTFEEVRLIVGGPVDSGLTNMWKKRNTNYAKPFVKNVIDSEAIELRYKLWAKSLL